MYVLSLFPPPVSVSGPASFTLPWRSIMAKCIAFVASLCCSSMQNLNFGVLCMPHFLVMFLSSETQTVSVLLSRIPTSTDQSGLSHGFFLAHYSFPLLYVGFLPHSQLNAFIFIVLHCHQGKKKINGVHSCSCASSQIREGSKPFPMLKGVRHSQLLERMVQYSP